MKKTLLSVLAGLAVIGSVSAAPSVDVRKGFCEKYPDKFVWVEKTQACIPINPCKSNDDAIKKAYCNYDFEITCMMDENAMGKVVQKYAQEVLKVSGTPLGFTDIIGHNYFAMKTSDGGFVEFELCDGNMAGYLNTLPTDYKRKEMSFWAAGNAYGLYCTDSDDGLKCYTEDVDLCQQVASFASELYGKTITAGMSVNGERCYPDLDKE